MGIGIYLFLEEFLEPTNRKLRVSFLSVLIVYIVDAKPNCIT